MRAEPQIFIVDLRSSSLDPSPQSTLRFVVELKPHSN